MISRIPTPHAHVDTSRWPLVNVHLVGAPSDDEYRVTLGRLRSLRSRKTPHVVIIDARSLSEAPVSPSDARIAKFLHETATLRPIATEKVIVVASLHTVRHAFATLLSSSQDNAPISVVQEMHEALAEARTTLRFACG